MPSIGTRGDTFFDPAERRRRAGISDFFNAQEIGGRFAPLDADNFDAPFNTQLFQSVTDVFFGVITADRTRPTRFNQNVEVFNRFGSGGGSERIVGRELLSIGGQIQRDIDIFNELERQELLPGQTTQFLHITNFQPFSSLLTVTGGVASLLPRGRGPGPHGAPQSQQGIQQGLLFGISPDQFPTSTDRFGNTTLGTSTRGPLAFGAIEPIIGPSQLTNQQVFDFFRPDIGGGRDPDGNLIQFTPEERGRRDAEIRSFQTLRSQLPFFPQNTTIDEATQIQERRANQARKFGDSTGPVFFPGTVPGGSLGLPSGAPSFARIGRGLEPLPTSTNRFGERKIGGLSDEDDESISAFLLSLQQGNPTRDTSTLVGRTQAQRFPTNPGARSAPADFISLFDGGQLIQDEEGLLISRRRPV